jgi:diguanylate cyclase (GGDEF)-like protein
MSWQLGLAANARGLSRTGQLRSNKLGAGTALIFFSCGMGHMLHAGHLIETPVARLAFDWHMAVWDTFTAGVAFFYLSLRRSYPRLLESPEMFDNEQRAALEEELEFQAFHDDLTGLPNRPLLMDRLSGALARGMRRRSSCAVLFLDLDRFKVVNDSLGHMFGDKLLQQIAERLDGCVRPEDTVARIGGDEFVVLVEQVATPGDAYAVADRIATALAPAVTIAGHELFISTTIGIAISRPGQDRPGDLLRDADVALYRAKAAGPAQVALFDPGMGSRPRARLELETDLRHAVERGELELHYQPKVRLEDGSISGAEALLRWRHPTRGLVMPNEFVPVAEETGIVVELGRWVLAEACRAAALWPEPMAVCVNLSAREFQGSQLPVAVARSRRWPG